MSFVKTYSAARQVEFHAAQSRGGDGAFLTLGRIGNQGLISWCDPQGDPIWTLRYGSGRLRICFISAIEIGDQGWCVLGRVRGRDEELIVIRIDQNGVLQWQKHIHISGGDGQYFITKPLKSSVFKSNPTDAPPRECVIVGSARNAAGQSSVFFMALGAGGNPVSEAQYPLKGNATLRSVEHKYGLIWVLGGEKRGRRENGLALFYYGHKYPVFDLTIAGQGDRVFLKLFHFLFERSEDEIHFKFYGEYENSASENGPQLCVYDITRQNILDIYPPTCDADGFSGAALDSTLTGQLSFASSKTLGTLSPQMSGKLASPVLQSYTFEHISNDQRRPLICGHIQTSGHEGLLLSTDADLQSCKTRGRGFERAAQTEVDLESHSITPRDLRVEVKNLKLSRHETRLNITDVCGAEIIDPPEEDLPDDTPLSLDGTTLIQSPYLNLQAAGSDGSIATPGIMTRWIFGGDLGDNHLPKGQAAPTGAKYNRADDYVRLYKFAYPQALEPLSLDLESRGPDYVDDANYMWVYDLGAFTLYLRFENASLYDALRVNHDPGQNPSVFFSGDNANRILVEFRGALAYEVELGFNRNSNAVPSRYEALATDGEQFNADYQVCARGTTELAVQTVRSSNIAAIRLEPGNAVLTELKVFTYRAALEFAMEAGIVQSIGRYALTKNKQAAHIRLSTQTPSLFDNHWKKFIGGAAVNAQNYRDRWAEPASGLRHGVSKYIELSQTDPKAEAVLRETLPPDADSSWVPNQMQVSYLDMLRIASLDYHNARTLGLGHMDVSGAASAERFFYVASYVTEETLSPMHSGRIQHISMSLPTSVADSRLPRAPYISDMNYGLTVPTANGTPYPLTDVNGYTPDGEGRYINHAVAHDVYHMQDSGGFFASSLAFDLHTERNPVFFGMSYRKDGEPNWRRPEITADVDYQDLVGHDESLPTPFKEVRDDFAFTHVETQNGVHQYSPYSISLFSTASGNGPIVTTDYTELPIPNRMLPPSNFHVQLIQEEDIFAPILTTADEQAMLGRIPSGSDETLIRIVFDYNHVQEGNYSLTRAATQDTIIYPDPIFADDIELFFREKPPQNIRGKTGFVTQVSEGVWIVESLDFPIYSAGLNTSGLTEILHPEVSSAEKNNYTGGVFVCGSARFEITEISYPVSAPHNPIFKIKAALERETDDTNGTPVMALSSPLPPPSGELFMAIENVGNRASWGSSADLSAKVQISPGGPDWNSVAETTTDDMGYTNTKHIRGFHKEAIVSQGGLNPHHYVISFTNFELPPHPQEDDSFPQSGSNISVSWRKGTVRIPLNDGTKRDLKVELVETTNNLTVLHAVDVSLGARVAPYNTANDPLVTVNFYPGYKVYLRADNSAGLTRSTILPSYGEGTRQTLMSARAVDYDMPADGSTPKFASGLCIPQILLAQEIRPALRPLAPSGLNYATPPDAQHKSTFELGLNFEDPDNPTHKPFGVVVYRTDIFAILKTLYLRETAQTIIAQTFPPESDKFFEQRWAELLNVKEGDTDVSLSAWRVDDDRGDITLPMPDRPSFFAAGLPLTGEPLVLAVRRAIDAVLKPLTAQPILYDFVRDWAQGHRPHKGPQVTEKDGQPLIPTIDGDYEGLDYDIAPMAYINSADSGAPDLTFIDFTLDGSKHTDSVYFYTVCEMGNKMDLGPRSAMLGPVKMVNLTPPEAPQFRRVLTRPDGVAGSGLPSIEIEVLKPPVDEEITGIRLYRSVSGLKAQSLRTMQKVKEIAITDLLDSDDQHYSVVDDFSDVDGAWFGETLFYRLVWTRIVPYEDHNGDPHLATAVSQPSRPVLSNIIDVTNRQALAPEITILSQTATTAKIQAKVEKVAHNCTYYLSYFTAKGVWTRLTEESSNAGEIVFLPPQDFDLLTEAGTPKYHRFKVDVLNASGLINLKDKITTIDLALV